MEGRVVQLNEKPQSVFPNLVDNLAKLLRGTAETGNFKCDDGISLSHRLQEHMEILFDLGVSVFVFKNDFVCASCFKLLDLARDILFIFVGAASSIAPSLHRLILSVNENLFCVKSFRLPVSFTDFPGFSEVFGHWFTVQFE